jgi:hypothetical protein
MDRFHKTLELPEPLFHGQFQVLAQQGAVYVFLVRLDNGIEVIRRGQIVDGIALEASSKKVTLILRYFTGPLNVLPAPAHPRLSARADLPLRAEGAKAG